MWSIFQILWIFYLKYAESCKNDHQIDLDKDTEDENDEIENSNSSETNQPS
jgi:hypothetical protein